MGAGLFLVIVGAILAFAVHDGVPGLNLTVTGIILMIAGGVVVAHARQRERERDLERRRSLDIDEQAAIHGAHDPQPPAVVTEVVDWPHQRRSLPDIDRP